jgi:DNA-directed RNA polymerase specialized sigma24 family protein
LVDAIARYSNNRGGSFSLEELERVRDLSAETVPENPIPAATPRSISRRLDEETLPAMVREYDVGATTAELRLKYGLAQGSLLKLLRANGAVIRRQGLTAAQEKAAVGLYESGLSIGNIAEQFSASSTTVRNCLLRAHVEMRGTHDWHDAPPAPKG